MNRHSLVGTLALAFGVIGLSTVPAWAGQEGARPNSSGSSTGTATSRGGDSGGSATSSGGSSSTSSGSGGGSSPTSSMGSSSTPTAWSSFEAPSRSNDQGARTRSGSSTSSGERAVSRSGGETNAPRGGRTASSAGSSDSSAPTRSAVPAYARPRDGRPVIGTATDRGSLPPPPSGGGGNGIIYYPYYPWGFWGPGYGYGLGYMFYDPFGYDPFGYGGYYGGGGGGGYGGYSVSRSYPETGGLRLKIDPKKAQVYVDGYYVGVVDDFDGTFQKLSLDSGTHRIEVKADGFQAADFEVLIAPGQTVTYKGELKGK
jgi:hypothetical protein